MSTYEELSLIVSIALLIVNILNYTQKKQHLCSGQVRCYFKNLKSPETDRRSYRIDYLVKYIIIYGYGVVKQKIGRILLKNIIIKNDNLFAKDIETC